MDKSPDAFRTISEVADWLNTPAHVLRFWESRFSQVKPVKRAGGRRYYRPSDMILLGGIKKLLHEDGMTIRGVQKLLREHGVRYVASMSPELEGIEPVTPLPESIGPLGSAPAAPMAEDVPTGAYETTPPAEVEKVVPFARPDQQEMPPADPPAQRDMFDFDAPVTPTPVTPDPEGETEKDVTQEDSPESDTASDNEYPDFTRGYDPQPASESASAAPEDSNPSPASLDEVTQDTAPDATGFEDEQAFEAALQNALSSDADPVNEAADPQDIEPDLDHSYTSPEATDFAPDAEFAADLAAMDGLSDVENPIGSLDVSEDAMDLAALDDVTPEEFSTDPVDAPASFDPASVPADPTDDAEGLDVYSGVLGRLTAASLANADPEVLQAIAQRAQALHDKLAHA
ncbi:MerR-like DNA binding protein [Pacificibacter maritimus]|uniref:MerR-like DNA binding protein n=1 Tax=Pacificibacter maritimus TaxID=762213 RepID=A0A3N4V3F8_9RHOB|nr:MerR family transcriptional regulator [Pacificibacter maritimus]RPE71637.1 MerR-like DNA binding protein [Pacificibacter maritimus]